METVRGRFGICICKDNCDDLELLKVYQILPDDTARSKGYFRVVDDSEEDYLYPQNFFITLELPQAVEQRLLSVVKP
jgi:hypothetical protein